MAKVSLEGRFRFTTPSISRVATPSPPGDFNHDGAPDLAFTIEDNGKVAILLNTK
jgi:hypothetical protein